MQAKLLEVFYETGSKEDFDAFGWTATPWIRQQAFKSFKRGTRNREIEAEDIVGQVLTRLFRMAPEQRWSRRVGPLENWLARVVQNCVRDTFRKQTRKNKNELTYREHVYHQSSNPSMSAYMAEKRLPGFLVNQERTLSRVMAEVQKMDETKQAIFKLRYLNEMSYPRIGKLMGIDNQKARRVTIGIMAELQARLREDGGCAA